MEAEAAQSQDAVSSQEPQQAPADSQAESTGE